MVVELEELPAESKKCLARRIAIQAGVWRSWSIRCGQSGFVAPFPSTTLDRFTEARAKRRSTAAPISLLPCSYFEGAASVRAFAECGTQSKSARAASLSKPKMRSRSLPLVLAECGRSAAHEGLPPAYSDLQRQAARFRPGFRTRAGACRLAAIESPGQDDHGRPKMGSVWSRICCGEHQNRLISRRLKDFDCRGLLTTVELPQRHRMGGIRPC